MSNNLLLRLHLFKKWILFFIIRYPVIKIGEGELAEWWIEITTNEQGKDIYILMGKSQIGRNIFAMTQICFHFQVAKVFYVGLEISK